MKRLILLVAAACIAAHPVRAASSAAAKSDVERHGLHGRVHTVRTEIVPQGSERKVEVPGVHEVSYTADGWTTEIVNTANGNRTSHVLWKRNGERIMRSEVETRKAPDPHNEITTYDVQGRPVERSIYNPNGTLRERTVSLYGESGTRETKYDGSGRVIDTYVRHTRNRRSGDETISETYTDDKLESRTVVKPTADGGVRRETFRYGRDGQLSLAELAESSGETTRIALTGKAGWAQADTLDSHGRYDGVQTVYDTDHSVTKNYYQEGRWMRAERYAPDGKLIRTKVHSYDNDEHGNWIRRTTTMELHNGEKSVIEIGTQVITYY